MKKMLKYIWEVITNLVVIFIIFRILSFGSTDFEKIILCSLVLIYLSISLFMSTWGFQQMVFTGHFYKELKDIKCLLNKKFDEDEKKEFNKFEKKRDRNTFKYYINLIFGAIASLITIIYLFKTLY